jgi:hypothetical protein
MRSDKTVVIGHYMTIAEIAALKQDMIGGRWEVAGSCAIRVNPSTTDEQILLDLSDADGKPLGQAAFDAIDYQARTATARWSSVAGPQTPRAGMPDSALDLARSEFGIVTLKGRQSQELQ